MTEPSVTPGPGPAGVDHRNLFVDSTVAMLVIDLEARAILDVNAAALALLGFPEDQVLGRPGRDFLEEPSADHVLRLRGLRGERVRTMATVRTATGPRSVEVSQIPSGAAGVVFVQAVDLTDIVEANIALEARTVALQSQRGSLESFASRIAHDLRSPLSSVAGFADLLQRTDLTLTDEQRRDMLERISANARSLSTMIGEVMDDALGHADESDDADTVEALFGSLRSILESEVISTGARLVTTTEVERLPVTVAAVRQPLLNLVSNSIKYRHPDRLLMIEVAVVREPGGTSIRVRDNGLGVSGDPEVVFDKGERGPSSAGTVGTGLGLAFARDALRDIGGDLCFEPTLAAGACFRIDLPAAEAEPVESPLGSTLASGLRSSQLADVFDAAPVPALLVDLDQRRVLRMNRNLEKLLGFAPEDVVGQRGRALLADPSLGDHLRRLVLEADGAAHFSEQVTVRTATGDRVMSVVGCRVPDSNLGVFQVLDG